MVTSVPHPPSPRPPPTLSTVAIASPTPAASRPVPTATREVSGTPQPAPTSSGLVVEADLVGVFFLGPGFGSGWDVDGCPMLDAESGRYVVLYPEGWTIRQGRDGIELVSAAGVVYAREGDLVAVDGTADGEAHFDCSGTVFRTSRVVATSLPFDEGMIATPSTVSAGEVVEVTFREPTDRGLAYVLERERRGSWDAAFQLISDKRGGPPLWQPTGDEFEVDLVGISGTGADRVLIPPPAPPGNYRLCVWLVPMCVPLTVAP